VNLIVSMHSDKPIYEQLKEQIKTKILTNTLSAYEQLPSVRVLSKELRIGIITVKRAYDDLVNEGFLLSKPAKGYYVLPVDRVTIKKEYVHKIRELILRIMTLKDEVGLDDETMEILWKNKGDNQS